MVQNRRIMLAVASLLSGLIYYLCWRWLALPLTDLSAGSFPSFVFVFAFGLLLPKLPTKWQLPYQSHWLLLTLVTEPLFGTAALLDVLAAVLGYGSVQVVERCFPQPTPAIRSRPLGFVLAPLLLIGSYGPVGSEYEPVYLSYAALRSAVITEAPRPMRQMGRLVIYQDHLFVNELNKGLHIIDNTVPSAPKAIGFINIPGNTDVSIRDGMLYADSFIDLVVIDIQDPGNVVETNRVKAVFPWNQYQMVGTNEWFDANEENGVVIALNKR